VFSTHDPKIVAEAEVSHFMEDGLFLDGDDNQWRGVDA
jgi:hypothetical protein